MWGTQFVYIVYTQTESEPKMLWSLWKIIADTVHQPKNSCTLSFKNPYLAILGDPFGMDTVSDPFKGENWQTQRLGIK